MVVLGRPLYAVTVLAVLGMQCGLSRTTGGHCAVLSMVNGREKGGMIVYEAIDKYFTWFFSNIKKTFFNLHLN